MLLTLPTRTSEIQKICSSRQVRFLIHFTRIQNLAGILKDGLLSRDFLENESHGLNPIFNDLHRLDGCRKSVSLSISFPNYQMFYKLHQKNYSEWVVVELDASILWDLDCSFSWENAASSNSRSVSIEERKSEGCLLKMFAENGGVSRSTLAIPSNYPTHPQSEVLVLEKIPTKYIRQIYFHNQACRERWLTHFKWLLHVGNKHIVLKSGDEYFRPRKDWEFWQAYNKQQRSS